MESADHTRRNRTRKRSTANTDRTCRHAASSPICSVVRIRALQIFFTAAVLLFGLAGPLRGALSNGQRYTVNFSDVDGRTLSTAAGHLTVLVLATKEDLTRAYAVRDNIPDYCPGSEQYRMI